MKYTERSVRRRVFPAAAPRLEIRLDRIAANVRALAGELGSAADVVGVVKGIAAAPAVVRTLQEAGAAAVADSRIERLSRLRRACPTGPLVLLRTPPPADAGWVWQAADLVVLDGLEAAQALSRARPARSRELAILVAVDAGDLREGVAPDDVPGFARRVDALPGLRVVGLSGNFGCLHPAYPHPSDLRRLADLGALVGALLRHGPPLLSVGGSALLPLIRRSPATLAGVTHVRLGEALLLGTDGVGAPVPGTRPAITLEATVIRRDHRPVAQGGPPVPRALLALGYQDVPPDELLPADPGVEIVAASSDHMVVRLRGAATALRPGDPVRFHLTYHGMASAAAASTVRRRYRTEPRAASRRTVLRRRAATAALAGARH